MQTRSAAFEDADFENRDTYSELLLSRRFYEAFAAYDYILIYQLDCLVFSDELEAWCAAGYDYIGAPWFVEKNIPASGLARVGNGGFSLRRVDSFLRVLGGRSESTLRFWVRNLANQPPDVRARFRGAQRVRKHFQVVRDAAKGVRSYAERYGLNEDHFWSDRARVFDPTFTIAPVDVALHFAFECAPRYCFARTGRRLPFGCHAWAEWDRDFWEPYLIG